MLDALKHMGKVPMSLMLGLLLWEQSAVYGSWLTSGGDNWSQVVKNNELNRLAERGRNGDVDAMRKLGIISIKGIKVKPSAAIAAKWWRKAADAGDARSMMYLGDLYRSGKGVGTDHRRAMSYYAEAYRTAEMNEGEKIPTSKDNILVQRIEKLPFSVSASWWSERAERDDTYALYYLATLKKKERKGILSDEEVDAYMVKAALNGHEQARKTVEKAEGNKYMTYWEQKAKDGSVDSLLRCGKGYYNSGNCTDAEAKRALYYYRKAAEEGSVEAIAWIKMYHEKSMNRCYEYLISNDLDAASEILELWKERTEFNPTPLMEKLLQGQGANARNTELVARLPGLLKADRLAATPYVLLAVQNNQPQEVVETLIDCGYDVNLANKQNGETPLMLAAKKGNASLVRCLLASPDIKLLAADRQKKTAMDYAACTDVKQLIQERMKELNVTIPEAPQEPPAESAADAPPVVDAEPAGSDSDDTGQEGPNPAEEPAPQPQADPPAVEPAPIEKSEAVEKPVAKKKKNSEDTTFAILVGAAFAVVLVMSAVVFLSRGRKGRKSRGKSRAVALDAEVQNEVAPAVSDVSMSPVPPAIPVPVEAPPPLPDSPAMPETPPATPETPPAAEPPLPPPPPWVQ